MLPPVEFPILHTNRRTWQVHLLVQSCTHISLYLNTLLSLTALQVLSSMVRPSLYAHSCAW